jgi:hypothetical protein
MKGFMSFIPSNNVIQSRTVRWTGHVEGMGEKILFSNLLAHERSGWKNLK